MHNHVFCLFCIYLTFCDIQLVGFSQNQDWLTLIVLLNYPWYSVMLESRIAMLQNFFYKLAIDPWITVYHAVITCKTNTLSLNYKFCSNIIIQPSFNIKHYALWQID